MYLLPILSADNLNWYQLQLFSALTLCKIKLLASQGDTEKFDILMRERNVNKKQA